MLMGLTIPVVMRSAARTEQKSMWIIVSVMGKWKSMLLRIYLLKTMTEALMKIHSAMYLHSIVKRNHKGRLPSIGGRDDNSSML